MQLEKGRIRETLKTSGKSWCIFNSAGANLTMIITWDGTTFDVFQDYVKAQFHLSALHVHMFIMILYAIMTL